MITFKNCSDRIPKGFIAPPWPKDGRAHLGFLVCVFLLLLIQLCCVAQAEGQPKRVLFLSSYHQGDPWTNRVIEGFSTEIQKQQPKDLFVEFLDARRIKPSETAELVRNYLKQKYQRTPIDLVVCSDDPALDFLLVHRRELFPGVPIVFCGINDFTPARLGGQLGITGVNEAPDIKGTIDLILKLQPKTKQIVAITSDGLQTYRANLDRCRRAVAEFSGQIRLIEYNNLQASQAKAILASLPRDAVAIRLGALLRDDGRELPLVESDRLIALYSPVPTYCLWDFDLGVGTLGGKLISGLNQGIAAAALAERVLSGESPEAIPVVDSPNETILDWQELTRFQLDPDNIPPGATIINKSLSLWIQYKIWIVSILAFILFQTVLITLLVIARKRRKQALRELYKKEEQYRDILENAPVGIFQSTPEGRYQASNPRHAAILGYESPADLISSAQNIARDMYIDPAEREPIKRLLVEQGQVNNVEVRRKRKDGSVIWVSLNARVGRDKTGQVLFHGFVTDITSRKQAEYEREVALEAQRQSELQFRAVFEHAPVGLLMTDGQSVVLDCNEHFSAIFGVPREKYLGVNLQKNLPEGPVRQLVVNVMALGGTQHYQGPYVSFLSGKELTISFSTRKISSDLFITIMEDITERKKMEDERLELERRLFQSQKLESLGILAGGIAHDFNNLLAVILGNLELAMLQLPPSSPARPKIEQAEIAAKRSADLTRQMLAYSGKGHFIITNIDIDKLVQENAHLFTAVLTKGADLKLNLTENLPYIAADIGQIQQVVMNLITNAAEALGDDPGVVTLSTGVTDCDEACLEKSRAEEKATPGRFVFLEVTDTGCGMDEDTLARFFDPFFSTKFTGRGLGMSAVLGIVRGHKGAIFVDSRVGQGTSIRVLFPVSLESIAVGQLQSASKPIEPKLTFSGTILMVDDEEMIRDFCSSILKAMGFKVLTAANGEQAVSLLRDNAKDIVCVLLDLTMPRMDGLAAFTEMQLINPNIPVILSSGYSEQEAVQRFSGQKPSGFLQKPFQVKELRAELARVLAKTV